MILGIPSNALLKCLKDYFGEKRKKKITKVSMIDSGLTSMFAGDELLCNC